MYIVDGIDYRPAVSASASGGILLRMGTALATWRRREVHRRCMANLDDHILADIGLVRPVPLLRAIRLDRAE